MEGTSRSHRFFLNLDPVNPPPIDRLCFHWNDLANDHLSTEEWGAVIQRLLPLNIALNKADRQIFADTLKHPAQDLRTYTKALEALYYASSASDIIAAMQFFSRHNEKIEPVFFENSHLKLRQHLPHLSASDIAATLYSFNKSRYLPHDDFWNDMRETWVDKFKDAESTEIRQAYEHAAKLALPMTAGMISLFNEHLLQHSDDLQGEPRDRLFWTAAMIDNQHDHTILADTVPALLSAHDMVNATMRNTVCAWFSILDKKPLLEKGNNSSSKSEIRLRDIFETTGRLRAEKDHVIPYVASPVDIRLDVKGRDIIVEMDGITHFNFTFNGERRYNGQTLLNSAVKAKMADKAHLLHIDDCSYNYLYYRCNHDEQGRIARMILEDAVVRGAGNYRVILNESQILLTHLQNNSLIPS